MPSIPAPRDVVSLATPTFGCIPIFSYTAASSSDVSPLLVEVSPVVLGKVRATYAVQFPSVRRFLAMNANDGAAPTHEASAIRIRSISACASVPDPARFTSGEQKLDLLVQVTLQATLRL